MGTRDFTGVEWVDFCSCSLMGVRALCGDPLLCNNERSKSGIRSSERLEKTGLKRPSSSKSSALKLTSVDLVSGGT